MLIYGPLSFVFSHSHSLSVCFCLPILDSSITEHENWFGSDEILGPLAISIKRERVEGGEKKEGALRHLYRLIVRSTEVRTIHDSSSSMT